MTTSTHLRCSFCEKGIYERESRSSIVSYRGLSLNMVMEVLYCPNCGEEVLHPGITFDPFERLYNLVDSCHSYWQLR